MGKGRGGSLLSYYFLIAMIKYSEKQLKDLSWLIVQGGSIPSWSGRHGSMQSRDSGGNSRQAGHIAHTFGSE